MKRVWLALTILTACVAGCQPNKFESTPDLRQQGEIIMGGDKKGDESAVGYNVQLKLKLAAIEAPIGTISDSEELWSYLDEESIRPLGKAGLGRNGIRVGIGKIDTWDDLASILEDLTGRPFDEDIKFAELGKPLALRLKKDEPVKTVFVSFDDRSLSGKDYPPGDHVLAVSFSVDPDDRSQVMLTAVPQIHSSYRPLTYEKSPSGYAAVNKPTIFSLFPLAFQLRMPRRDFLLIGPTSEARRPTSAGNNLFVYTREGMQFETVYVLVPELVIQPAR